MVQVQSVCKSFTTTVKRKKKTQQVLKDVGFTATPGNIYGLLGPNGAGKTTTLRIIASLLKADQGWVRVQDLDVEKKDFLDKPVEKLSTGMSQKASLAIALIHDPQIIIFDEPTNGLDILAAKTVVDFLQDYRARGKMVIVSTHIMSEAERLCDQVGIMLQGKIIDQGSQDELKERHKKASLEEVFFALAKQQGTTDHV